jgi:hypothetical protein
MTEPKARLLVIGAGVNGSVCAAGLHREVDVSVLAALAPGRPPVHSRTHATAAGRRSPKNVLCRGALGRSCPVQDVSTSVCLVAGSLPALRAGTLRIDERVPSGSTDKGILTSAG